MSIKQTLGKAIVNLATKAFGVSGLARLWDNGDDVDGEKGSSKATKPYKQVGLVFSCVNALIDGILGLPAAISTIDDLIVESGPVYDLLFGNCNMSWGKFVTESIGHYALTRDVFWIFIETDGSRPKEILVVNGSQMHPLTDNSRADGVLLSWEFRGLNGERAKFTTEEVHQWKNFNPYDRFHGLGPAKAAELSINYSYASSLFNMSALENGAELGLILSTDQSLDADQIAMLRSQMDARHKGAGNAKRTAVLQGGLKAQTLAMNMANMEMAKISQMSDVRLCSAFGVPPECVGIVTEAQYAQGPAQRDFVFNTLIPLARLFAGEISHGIIAKHYSDEHQSAAFKDSLSLTDRSTPLHKRKSYRCSITRAKTCQEKLFLWFDYDQHPTVQEANRESTEKILKFVEAGVPLNELIDAHDLPYEHQPWGDEWWIGMGLVPASYTLEAGLEGLTGPSAPEESEDDLPEEDDDKGKAFDEIISLAKQLDGETHKAINDEQHRLRIWQNWVISWGGLEREYKEALRKYFLRQQRILSKKLKVALDQYKAVTKNTEDIVARVTFDLRLENDKLKVINHVHFSKASELGIRQTLSEIAQLSGKELETIVGHVKRKPAIKAALVISSRNLSKTNKITQDNIAAQISEGLENGENLNELTDRIKNTLGSNRAKALRIARTQTAGAVDTGRHEGMRAAAVERKGWITSRDDHVRAAHKEAEARYKDGILLDTPFEVGGESLMYPGDPSGSAANIINCRCLHIAMAAKGKAYGISYYTNIKFYSYSDMKQAHSITKDDKNEK